MNLIKTVQLDASVVLKIAQHGKRKENGFGQLLGLDIEEKLQVTSCFPLPNLERNQYASLVQKKLAVMNFDNNVVGMYVTTNLEAPINHDVLSFLLNLQYNDENNILLVFDPLQSVNSIYFKAFRLPKKIVNDKSLSGFSELEELEIEIRNSPFLNSFVYGMPPSVKYELGDAVSLVEKAALNLANRIDEYTQAQEKDNIKFSSIKHSIKINQDLIANLQNQIDLKKDRVNLNQ